MRSTIVVPAVHRWLRILVAGLVLLSVAGCGARWSDEQHDALLARHEKATAGNASPTESAADDSTRSSTTVRRGGGVGGGGGNDGGPVGNAADPGQAVVGGNAGGEDARPCTAPSDEIGVSDDTITVGSIASLSGPVPGLGASADAATRAYVAYRNATGGVCGRQIELKAVDDGTDNARYRAVVGDMASQVLGLAGGFAGGDAGGADVLEDHELPVVTVAVSDQAQAVSTLFDVNPPFDDVNQPIEKYDWVHDQGIREAALVWINVEQTTSEINKQRAQLEASGIEITHENALPLSTLSYDSAARGVANSKADYLFFLADAGASASMAKAMDGVEHEVVFQEYLSAYGSNFPELTGAAGEGTVSWIRTVPNEERGSNRELGTFLEWIGRVAPNAYPDTFAADAWAGAKAFFDALDALPGPISRQALVDQLRSIETYDADGMLGPIRLGAKRANGCLVGMELEGGSWTRVVPNEGFLC